MIQKLFGVQSKSVTGAAMLLGSMSLLSRVVGLFRDRLFAHEFGAGQILDAYYAAFRIPDLVYNILVMGALSAGFIPIFLSLWEENKEQAWRTVNTLLNLFGIVLSTVSLLLGILAPYILPHLVPGFDPQELAETIMLTRIMLFSPILLGLSGIVSSVLQSFKLFIIYSLAPIIYNIGIIVGVVFFVPILGPNGLAYGVILGCALHLIIQLPSLRASGFRYHFLFRPDKAIRDIAIRMIPRILSLAAYQVNFIIATVLASGLTAGSIAIFNFANNLQSVPLGMIGISFAMAAFPVLSSLAAQKNIDGFKEQLSHTVRVILFFIVPMTIVFLLLRAQIVRVILGSGNFDWRATIMTANTLAFFCLSLFAQCLVLVFVRAFFALHDTWTPLLVSIVQMFANVILSFILLPIFDIPGLAMAFSIATVIQLALLWLLLRKKIGTLHELRALIALSKISVSALLMAITVQALKTPLAAIVDMTRFWGIATQGAVAGIAGFIVYGTFCRILKLQEMLHLQASLKRRWLRMDEITPNAPDLETGG